MKRFDFYFATYVNGVFYAMAQYDLLNLFVLPNEINSDNKSSSLLNPGWFFLLNLFLGVTMKV